MMFVHAEHWRNKSANSSIEIPVESRAFISSESSTAFEGRKVESERKLGAANCSFTKGCGIKRCKAYDQLE
jgi:hypothetical protein